MGTEAAFKYNNISFYLELRPLMFVDEDLPSFAKKDGFVKGGIWSARFFRFTTNFEYGTNGKKSFTVNIYRYAVDLAWQFVYWSKIPLSLYVGTDNANEISTYHKIKPYMRFGVDLK